MYKTFVNEFNHFDLMSKNVRKMKQHFYLVHDFRISVIIFFYEKNLLNELLLCAADYLKFLLSLFYH